MYTMHHANLLDWSRDYRGPKYHALLCDPPYHLTEIVKRFGKADSAPVNNQNTKAGRPDPYSNISKGFMGKTWDGIEGTSTSQEFGFTIRHREQPMWTLEADPKPSHMPKASIVGGNTQLGQIDSHARTEANPMFTSSPATGRRSRRMSGRAITQGSTK